MTDDLPDTLARLRDDLHQVGLDLDVAGAGEARRARDEPVPRSTTTSCRGYGGSTPRR